MSKTSQNWRAILFCATVSLGSLLMFSLEPMTGKRILPWFGGAAAVWATCLVFYQTALLAGYSYAAFLARHSSRRQAAIHSLLLLCSLALLPIGPGEWWAAQTSQHPALRILLMLTLSLALPFLTLAATSPLLQTWLANSGERIPYWLFAVSNAASLLALFAYPALVEPALTMYQQRWTWSAGYLVFAALSGISAWSVRAEPVNRATQPGRRDLVKLLQWFALSAASSMLLLSVTNHVTQNVAAVPLLWVVPLALYLLTFVIAFTERASRFRSAWWKMTLFGLALIAYAIYNINAVEPIQIALPILLFGLFAGCMCCHSELYALRPAPERLTTFYVAIAAGGAAGGIFVGLIAPSIFTGIYELPLSMLLTAALLLALLWNGGLNVRALWAGMIVAIIAVLILQVHAFHNGSLARRRSFYGALRVVQSGAGENQVRTLIHGTIEHGAQFLLLPKRLRPTTYYGPDSGIGIVLRECFPAPKRVGVIGLGAGTLTAYGENGDTFRIYEINRQVVDIAASLFFYLRETRARVEMVLGDARLSLQKERQPAFDVLAVDAFSGDAIPVHLLTREAFALYWRRLKPEGVLALHVSNNYLDLASVAHGIAEQAGYPAVLVRNHTDDTALVVSSDWVLISRNPVVLENPGIKLHSIPFLRAEHAPVWTDDYNNLIEVLKKPTLK